MDKHEKKAYLKQIKPCYKKVTKAEKQRILGEFCAVCGYHRKYAIRALNRRQSTQRSRQSGRKPTYDRETIIEPLKRICFAEIESSSSLLQAEIRATVTRLVPANRTFIEEGFIYSFLLIKKANKKVCDCCY